MGMGGKHTAHQYTLQRGKNPLGKKKKQYILLGLLSSKRLRLIFFEEGRVRNANRILSCRSFLCHSQHRAMQMCIFMTISQKNFLKFTLTSRYF